MGDQERIVVQHEALLAVYIEMKRKDAILAIGTGMVAVGGPTGRLLVTARHNFTGRDQLDGKPMHSMGALPDRVVVRLCKEGIGSWEYHQQLLLDADDRPLWIEHPELGSVADFAALPLVDAHGADSHAHLFTMPQSWQLAVVPGDPINVIGYPFGLQGSGDLAIWLTGFMATEPELDYRDQPCFLIDCRTRPGNSGAPVFARPYRVPRTRDTPVPLGFHPTLLGIYSGRVNSESDLGVVWKTSAIIDLLYHITPSWVRSPQN